VQLERVRIAEFGTYWGHAFAVDSPFRSLKEWGEWIEANAEPTNPDGNRTVLVGSGGRPATREELIAFVAEQNARHAREYGGE
jgi:hypothetical protein